MADLPVRIDEHRCQLFRNVNFIVVLAAASWCDGEMAREPNGNRTRVVEADVQLSNCHFHCQTSGYIFCFTLLKFIMIIVEAEFQNNYRI